MDSRRRERRGIDARRPRLCRDCAPPRSGEVLFFIINCFDGSRHPHPPCRRKKLRSARPALRAGLPPLRSFLLSPRGRPRGGPVCSCPKKTGRARSKRKALKGSPQMTPSGHLGGHVHAERLWALTLRLSSGSRRGVADVLAFRRVWKLLRREGGSGHLALLFYCRRLALPEESGAAAKREAGGVRARPVPVVLWQKTLDDPQNNR